MKAAVVALVLSIVIFGVVAAADDGGDITPPMLVAAAADRYQIDTSKSPQTITFTLHITDDLAGVRSVHVGFRHELGYNESRECQQWPNPYIRDITLRCAVEWPQYSAEGKWIVTWFSMSDGVGNWTDGNVANCTRNEQNRCTYYVYNDLATDVIRSMGVQITPLASGIDPPLYLPMVAR